MKSLLTSLKELHDSGFVHRDIKPANILVDKVVNENGKKKLIYAIGDFGLATHKDDSSGLFSPAGTPGYLPPETGCINGELIGDFKPYKSFEAAKKGDIFALGLTFYERLGKELNKFDRKKASEAEDLIVTMLDDDPKSRPTVDEALRDPFFK